MQNSGHRPGKCSEGLRLLKVQLGVPFDNKHCKGIGIPQDEKISRICKGEHSYHDYLNKIILNSKKSGEPSGLMVCIVKHDTGVRGFGRMRRNV